MSAKIRRGRTTPVDSRAGRTSAIRITVRRPNGPKPDFDSPVQIAARAARSQAWEERSGMGIQVKMKMKMKFKAEWKKGKAENRDEDRQEYRILDMGYGESKRAR